MTDLATLGLRIESQEAEVADRRLDGFEKSAVQAERATDALAMAARGLGASLNPVLVSIDASVRELVELQRAQHAVAAVSDLVTSEVVQEAAAVQALTAEVQQASTAHMQFSASAKIAQTSMGGLSAEFRETASAAQQADAHMAAYRQHMADLPPVIGQADAHMLAYRNQIGRVGAGLKLTAQDGLNFSRQMADIGVTAAMGMSPLMIAIQQGPQLFDVLQQAAIRSSMTIRQVMVATGAVIWTAMAPLLPVIAALALAVGVFAGSTALAARSMNKEFGDLTVGMGLTERQLEKVQNRGVTMGDVVVGTLKWMGDSIWNIIGPAVSKIGEWFSAAMDWTADAVVTANKLFAGVFLGTFRGIQAVWKDLPTVMGDAAISAANAVIGAIETMLNKAGAMFNQFLPQIKLLMTATGNIGGAMGLKEMDAVNLGRINNPYAGAAREAGKDFATEFAEGMGEAAAYVDQTIQALRDSIKEVAEGRIGREAGDAEAARNTRVSTGDDEAKRLADDTRQYVEGLLEQAKTLGMNTIEAKEYEIAQRAAAAAQIGMNKEVEDAGRLLIEKMKAEATNTRQMDDAIAMLELERRMIGATNTERAVALAQLAEAQRLKSAGVNVGDAGYADAIARAGDLARATEGLRTEQDRYNDSLRLTLDLARQADDIMRDAASGFADAFGDAGKSIGGMLTSMTGLQSRLAQIAEQREELSRRGILSAEREAMLERDRAAATVGAYGDMISAARVYFDEGSAGYKILLAIEQAYRIQQMIGSIQAMTVGDQETGLSLVNSARKAAAYGIEAVANAYRSIPYPFNIAAVAATVTGLAALGIKIAGGSSGGGPANDNHEATTANVRAVIGQQGQAQQQSASSIAQAVRVEIGVNDDRFNAYVDGRATPIARNASAQMGRTVMDASKRAMPGIQNGQRRLGTT